MEDPFLLCAQIALGMSANPIGELEDGKQQFANDAGQMVWVVTIPIGWMVTDDPNNTEG
jgi:hypothetical protein